jgi:hypothetical protein
MLVILFAFDEWSWSASCAPKLPQKTSEWPETKAFFGAGGNIASGQAARQGAAIVVAHQLLTLQSCNARPNILPLIRKETILSQLRGNLSRARLFRSTLDHPRVPLET